jgi:ubiquinone/menaquinone biosynthesis C-methylase UbiE
MFQRSARVYDLLYSFKDYAAESEALVEQIRSRNPEAHSLLDVACGTGVHLAHLRETFPDIAGVDLDPGLLAVARERLPDVPLTEGDMRSFDLGRGFDAVTCLFSSVGYLGSDDDLTRAIGAMAAHLEPGGVLIVDGWVRPDEWWDGINTHALAESDGEMSAARVARTWREGDVTVLEFEYLVATAEGIQHLREEHRMTLFTDEAYRSAFREAGLEPEIVAGPMEGRDRYLAVR